MRAAKELHVKKRASAVPNVVANGVLGAAAPVSGVAVGVDLVAVDRIGVALVVAAEEVGALEVAPPALVPVALVSLP